MEETFDFEQRLVIDSVESYQGLDRRVGRISYMVAFKHLKLVQVLLSQQVELHRDSELNHVKLVFDSESISSGKSFANNLSSELTIFKAEYNSLSRG